MIKKIVNYISIIKRKFKYQKKSYSFNGVDLIVDYIFKTKKNGFYLDVGAQHPISNNNTYILYKRGWSGINIDLDKKNIDLFNAYRKKDVNLATAVSDVEGETDLYFYHSKSALNTISRQNADFQKAKVTAIKRIKTQTINKIIENSPYKGKKIDFLSIDVEGSELSILKNFNFNKYSPKVIVVEYLDLSLKKLEIKNLNIDNIIKSDIYKIIISNNYTLANVLHSDLVFIHNDFKD
jgi:FkbM family methyltransferase